MPTRRSGRRRQPPRGESLMINDFEQRLAFVLGSRLTGSLAGKVFVPPAPAEGADPSLVVGVSALATARTGLSRAET